MKKKKTSRILFKIFKCYLKKKKNYIFGMLVNKEAIICWQYWLIEKLYIFFSDHKPLENMNIQNT